MTKPRETPTGPNTPRSGPLAGVKIVDMSSVVLGPLATLILGDLGADVIKIESGQDGKSGDMMRYAGASPTGDAHIRWRSSRHSAACQSSRPAPASQSASQSAR